MSDVFPISIQGAGTMRVQLVLALAVPTAPILTEINAVSSLDCTPYFRADAFTPTHDQQVVDDTRLSDQAVREALGLSSESLDMLRYVHNPQAAPAAAGNKAYDKFTPGLSAYLVIRFGTKTMLSAAAFATTQRIQVHAVTFGDQFQPIPVGDSPIHLIEQKITLTQVTPNFTIAA